MFNFIFNRFCLSKNSFLHFCFKPYLLINQINSFNNFLNSKNNSLFSIKKIIKKYFPIINKKKNIFIKVKKIFLEKPYFNEFYSKKKNIHYFSNIYIELNIFFIIENFFFKKKIFIGSIPYMTNKGSFIINGTERVLISQFVKSFGIYFFFEKNIICKIIPSVGSWIDIIFNKKIYFIFDKKNNFELNFFISYLGISKNFFLNFFFIKLKLKIIKGKKKIFFFLKKKFFFYKKISYLCFSLKKINFIFDNNYFNNIKKYEFIFDKKNLLLSKIIFFLKVIIFKHKIEKKYLIYLLKNYNIKKKKSLNYKKGILINFFRKIFIKNNFNIGEIGFLKINKNLNKKFNFLNCYNFLDIILKILKFIKFNLLNDDYDNLENKIVLNSGKLFSLKFDQCINLIKKSINFKIKYIKKKEEIDSFIDDNIITINFKEYFCNNELSQFLDQNNPLSDISHKRKISLISLKGIKKENCGFDIRDIHYSHYCKICPVDTPEGHNIGLINSFSFFSKINKYNLITTFYKISFNGKIYGFSFFDHKNEKLKFISNFLSTSYTIYGEIFNKPYLEIRYKNEFLLKKFFLIKLIEISGDQILSIGTSLIPFLENNDANRCLMGSNMQRQATPLINSEQPNVGTGNELIIGLNSGYNILNEFNGIVFFLDSYKIIIKSLKKIKCYYLKNYFRTNQNTIFHNTVKVKINKIVKKGEILADSYSTKNGEISLGCNIRVVFMSWYGYNYEDSIILSKKLVKKDLFTSIHIYEFTCVLKNNENGFDILSNESFKDDQIKKKKIKNGIIKIGEFVKPKDILIGKIILKEKKKNSPEEKLLKTIFSDNNFNYYEQPLITPKNIKGIIINIDDFKLYSFKKNIIKILNFEQIKYISKCLNNYFYEIFFFYLLKIIKDLFNQKIIINKKIFFFKNSNINFLLKIKCFNKKINFKLNLMKKLIMIFLKKKKKNYNFKINNILNYEDFEKNIIRIIKIQIAVKKKIKIGDKMSGRHGNKGVVSIILDEEDMPYDKNGISFDLILNPLGIPSRMNVGQILETYLGYTIEKINLFFKKKYNYLKKKIMMIFFFKNILKNKIKFNLNKKNFNFLLNKIKNFKFCTHNFDNVKYNNIKNFLNNLGYSKNGKISLFDGITGKKYLQLINTGVIYFMKLNHLVDDKIYSRSIGPYSLITQQPLGGKSNLGGQRLGEMEVWALEAYGASYILKEMLTSKSDDINGRIKLYKNIISGIQTCSTGIPETFQILLKEIQALCFDIKIL